MYSFQINRFANTHHSIVIKDLQQQNVKMYSIRKVILGNASKTATRSYIILVIFKPYEQ